MIRSGAGVPIHHSFVGRKEVKDTGRRRRSLKETEVKVRDVGGRKTVSVFEEKRTRLIRNRGVGGGRN